MVKATYALQMSFDATVIAGKLTANTWTTVPYLATGGLHIRRGITGTSPNDRLAGPGTLECDLLNMPVGTYSPGHASCRAGFGYGIPCRLTGTFAAVTRTLFVGRIRGVDPAPGQYRSRAVHIVVQDLMANLTDGRLGDISAQVDFEDSDMVLAVLAALPPALTPGIGFSTRSTDVYPYAFDDLKAGGPATTPLDRLMRSSWGKFWARLDGSWQYGGRKLLATRASSATLGDSDLDDLTTETSLASAYNRVRVTVHPRYISPPTTVLWSASAPISIPGTFQTIEVWGTYSDPDNPSKLIGGLPGSFTFIEGGVDVVANSAQDGDGDDWTNYLFGTSENFASTVKETITNNAPVPIWLTKLQSRGSGIYEDTPITVESYVADSTIGDQALDIDMPYQDDANIAQDLADYVRLTRAAVLVPATSFTINPQRSSTLMVLAHTLDICAVVTLNETVNGIASAAYMIHAADMTIAEGELMSVTYTVVPYLSMRAFALDDAVYGRLDNADAVLGFA